MDKLENTPADISISDSSILIGMAISLKRIADALEKLLIVPKMPEITPEQKEEMMKSAKSAGFIIMNKD